MTRRAFIAALAAAFTARTQRPCSGTLRTGKWFGNFGPGIAATLHGTHAIIPPHQAHLFQHDIENRIILDGDEMKRWLAMTRRRRS